MIRPPDLPEDVHKRLDHLSTHNDLRVRDAYKVVIEATVDENGRIKDDVSEQLREELPNEPETAF